VQTIILTRISGRTQVPEKEELSSLAAHQASLCLYLSAHHIENAQARLMEHYPSNTTVAICYRLGWEDEKILTVPLADMASVTQKENLTRTTLFVISPALNHIQQGRSKSTKSQLYSSHYKRFFR
jgi:precorrin-4/cobalt-precorrin-4 C11-methyltransferase